MPNSLLDDLRARDQRFAAGLPKILVCSDSAVLPTGLARVIRGIFTPIYEHGKFAIAQHGWFHVKPPTVEVPWPIIPVRRHASDERFFLHEDRFGQQSFDNVVEALAPDFVFVVGDYGTFDHILESKHRSSYQLILYLPLDSFPPNERWINTCRRADKMVFYTEFARRWGQSGNVSGVSIPHGVDTNKFVPLSNKERNAARLRLFQVKPTEHTFIIGTVGRVQPRKRLPTLIETVAHLRAGAYARCKFCKQLSLEQYDSGTRTFSHLDNEKTCVRCKQSAGWDPGKEWSDLKLYLHADPYENPLIPIKAIAEYWGLAGSGSIIWNPGLNIKESKGVSDPQLIELYQCLDLYVHPASGGGAELPPLESAACGIPIIAADAPAQNEYISKLEGSKLVPGTVDWDYTCAGYRVFSEVRDFAEEIIKFLEMSDDEKETLGRMNRMSSLAYDWTNISLGQWEPLFLSMNSSEAKNSSWRVLQEV